MPDPDRELRAQLRKLLDWEDAHAGYDAAVDGIPHEKRGAVPKGALHSVWQLQEHLRRTQQDILDFCRNPDYREMKWPEDYWPKSPAPASERDWDESVAAYRRDREAMKALADDPSVDLHATIPHGTGQTYLREILLVADHTAYHVGQLVLVRRLLGIWGSGS